MPPSSSTTTPGLPTPDADLPTIKHTIGGWLEAFPDMQSAEDKCRTRPHWHCMPLSDHIVSALRTAEHNAQTLVHNPCAILEARHGAQA